MKWLDDVDAARAEGFEEIGGEERPLGQAIAESRQWARTLFARGKGPYDAGRSARRRVHRATSAAPDLLCHDYDVDGLALSVVEGRSFVLVFVARKSLDLRALSAPERAGAVTRVAAAILHPSAVERGLRFRFPDRIEEGVTFSTNPDLDPRISGGWADRIDGGVHRGELFFLIYKRLPWLLGFADARAWLREGQRLDRRPRRLSRWFRRRGRCASGGRATRRGSAA